MPLGKEAQRRACLWRMAGGLHARLAFALCTSSRSVPRPMLSLSSSLPLRTMTEGNRPGIHHRTKSATTHSLHPGSIASSIQPTLPADFHHVAATTTLTMQVSPVDRVGRGPAISPPAMPHGHLQTTAPRQMGVEHMNRPHNQRDEIRLPYSSALTGVNAGERGRHPPTALSSSTVQGQLEPSSSSMSGDQPIQKNGSTICSTPVGPPQAVDAQQQGLSLFVANLPFVPVTAQLDRIQSDLLAHLLRLAKVDSVKARLGRFARFHSPSGSRQLLAFAIFSDVAEAKKLLRCRVPLFMGCHLRIEVSNMQRTLNLSSVRGQIMLEPIKNTKPWCDNEERFPNLFQGESQRDSLHFTRMLARELCLAFGPLVRIHTDVQPFEVVFADFEQCRRAKEVLSQLSSSMGIIVSIQSDLSNGQQRDMIGHSESDIEFSSDCLPIKTSSSSSVDLSSLSAGIDDGLDGDGRATVVMQGESVSDSAQEAPLSPLTEIPPTPTLTNTHEQSESEVEEQEMERIVRTKNNVDEIALSDAKRLNAHPAGPRHRDIDPCSVFVSRLPPVDNVEECLYGLFSADGLIKQVRVLVSRMNPPSKFAFVSFADVGAAQKALARNNQPFMGVFLNVRPRENSVASRRSSGPLGQPAASGSFQEGEEIATPMGPAVQGSPDRLALPVPSRLGSDFNNLEGTTGVPLTSNTTYKTRGATLPDRPSHWTQSRTLNNDGRSEPLGIGPPIGDFFRPPHAHYNGYPGELFYAMPPAHTIGPTGPPWPFAPLSPLCLATQPPTAAQSPSSPSSPFAAKSTAPVSFSNSPEEVAGNMGESVTAGQASNSDHSHGYPGATGAGQPLARMPMHELGTPYWPIVTMDPSGQRYVVHPLGGCCPSVLPSGPISPYPPSVGMQATTEQGSVLSREKPALYEDALHHASHSIVTPSHMLAPPLGFPPQYYAPYVAWPQGPTMPWPAHQQPCLEDDPQARTRRTNTSKPAKGNWPGGYESNQGPIQIPAVSNPASVMALPGGPADYASIEVDE